MTNLKYVNSVPYSAIKSQNIPGLADALVKAGLLNNTGDSGRGVTLTLAVSPSKSAAPHIPWVGAAALPVNLTGALVVTANRASSSTPAILVSVEGSVLFSSLLRLKKHTYGFANDQVRAYVELLGTHSINVTQSTVGYMNDPIALLAYMVSEKYLPFVNPVLAEPGLCIMNGNFIDHATISTVCLCGEESALRIRHREELVLHLSAVQSPLY